MVFFRHRPWIEIDARSFCGGGEESGIDVVGSDFSGGDSEGFSFECGEDSDCEDGFSASRGCSGDGDGGRGRGGVCGVGHPRGERSNHGKARFPSGSTPITTTAGAGGGFSANCSATSRSRAVTTL